MRRFIFSILLISLFGIFPVQIFAQTNTSGLIKSPIWFSKNPLLAGESVKIYTYIWNGSSGTLTGSVSFLDKDVILGKRSFSIKSENGEAVSIDWRVTAGEHVISARIDEAILVLNGKKEEATLSSRETEGTRQIIAPKLDLPSADDAKILAEEGINEIGEKIAENVPEKISKPVSVAFNNIDSWRVKQSESVNKATEEAKNELELIKSVSPDGTKGDLKTASNTENFADKPFKQVKLLFLQFLNFVLKSKAVFYVGIILVLYFILRSLFRKIINRRKYKKSRN